MLFLVRNESLERFHPIDYRVYSKQIRWNLEDPHDDLIKATVMLEDGIVMKIESFSLFPVASREAPLAGGMRGFAKFRFFFLNKKNTKRILNEGINHPQTKSIKSCSKVC